jgi:hypothetical protein
MYVYACMYICWPEFIWCVLYVETCYTVAVLVSTVRLKFYYMLIICYTTLIDVIVLVERVCSYFGRHYYKYRHLRDISIGCYARAVSLISALYCTCSVLFNSHLNFKHLYVFFISQYVRKWLGFILYWNEFVFVKNVQKSSLIPLVCVVYVIIILIFFAFWCGDNNWHRYARSV